MLGRSLHHIEAVLPFLILMLFVLGIGEGIQREPLLSLACIAASAIAFVTLCSVVAYQAFVPPHSTPPKGTRAVPGRRVFICASGTVVYKCGCGWGEVVYNVHVVGDSGIVVTLYRPRGIGSSGTCCNIC